MDILAAIALATEVPHPTQLNYKVVKQDETVFTGFMVNQMITQVIYQLLVMLILLYLGPTIFQVEYDFFNAQIRNEDGSSTWRLQHNTLMFQTFVLMCITNMFNCRVLPTENNKGLNIFTNIFGNYWFLIVVLAELNIQIALIGFPVIGVVFSTTPLTLAMQLTAIGCALGSLLVGLLLKLFNKNEFNTKILAKFQKKTQLLKQK